MEGAKKRASAGSLTIARDFIRSLSWMTLRRLRQLLFPELLFNHHLSSRQRMWQVRDTGYMIAYFRQSEAERLGS